MRSRIGFPRCNAAASLKHVDGEAEPQPVFLFSAV